MKPTPLLLTLSGAGSLLAAARWSAGGDAILAACRGGRGVRRPGEKIAAAEAKEKTENKQP